MLIINIKNPFKTNLIIYISPLRIRFSYTFFYPSSFLKVVIRDMLWNDLQVQ